VSIGRRYSVGVGLRNYTRSVNFGCDTRWFHACSDAEEGRCQPTAQNVSHPPHAEQNRVRSNIRQFILQPSQSLAQFALLLQAFAKP